MTDKRLTLQQKADYINQKANEILVTLEPGCTLSYNPMCPVTPEHNKEFHRNFQDIMMVLKDRGFKIWGSGTEWHITL
jgi:hypothetical protein